MKLFDNLQTKEILKGTILLYKGDTCKTVYKVNEGCLKSYVINKPSTIFIDAIEDSEISILTTTNYSDISQLSYDDLLEQNKKLVNNLITTNKRLANLLSATAEERYVDFVETYPTLVQRLPLKLIASYLGMTPEYLSDIRRKLARK